MPRSFPIRQGRTTEHWRLDRADPKRILFVGRFDRHKGGDLIIDAFARVLQEVPDARLWFVGPDRGDTSAMAVPGTSRSMSAIDSPVPWNRSASSGSAPSRSAALASLRRKALVSVVCSLYENFPLHCPRDAGSGLPDCCGQTWVEFPRFSTTMSNGLLHRASDSEDLASQIIRLLNDPERAATLANKAQLTATAAFP